MEVEVTSIPALTSTEQSLADMHTLFNLISVIQRELAMLGEDIADDPFLLSWGLATCERIKVNLGNECATLRFLRHVKDEESGIWNEIHECIGARPLCAANPSVSESLSNLRNAFHLLEARSRETLIRKGRPAEWLPFAPAEVYAQIQECLNAIAENSRHRFGFAFDGVRKNERDYAVCFSADCGPGKLLHLPLVLKEVLLDLVSNARKYTAVGGNITVRLTVVSCILMIQVEDDGIGIPPDELGRVAEFGYRASNVRMKPTMGRGMGLTKAFLATQALSGRMWIKSELRKGTRVTLMIPRPLHYTS